MALYLFVRLKRPNPHTLEIWNFKYLGEKKSKILEEKLIIVVHYLVKAQGRPCS